MSNLRDLFLLDPEVVFLNHGSFGACPRPVFERYQAWQLQLERQPVAFLDPERGYFNWMAETRSALGAYLGADPSDLVGCMNATHALNIVAQSLPLEPGDEILTTDHEYAALEKTWGFVTQRRGARIVEAKVPLPLTDRARFVEAVLAGMTDRTRVLFLSHITSPTALYFPVEELVAEARKRGIYTVIDGAHTPGHIPLDLNALGADFYAGNCHKWLLAPKGAAFLHARPEHQALLNPLVISHGWQPDRSADGPFGGTAFVDAMEMQGTRDPAAWLTVPEAIQFHAVQDWEHVAAACSDLAAETAERLTERLGTEPISSRAFSAPQMVAIPLPPCDPHWLKAHLYDQHRIEIPVLDWRGQQFVRLSVQGYTTRAELDLLVEATTEALADPARAG